MSCLRNFSRTILVIFNAIFVITGIAILGLCIFLKVDKTSKNIQDVVAEHADANSFSTSIIVLVVLGAAILLISSLGCCAAIFENHCLLGMYVFLLTAITIAEIGAGIFVAVVKRNIGSHIEKAANEVIKEKYSKDKEITQAIDILQAELKCCGANNYTDFSSLNLDVGKVPYSCCVLKSKENADPVPLNKKLCELEAEDSTLHSAKYLHTKGCVVYLESLVNKYSSIILGISLGIAAFEILLIILACCICRVSHSEDRTELIH